MIRSILMVVLAVAITGCATTANTCGGKGHKNVRIKYGDGFLTVDPIVRVKKKKELRFRLYPERRSALGHDYKVADVVIEGKVSPDDDWLTGNGSWDPDRYIMVCVDDSLAFTDYDYSVTVLKGGTSDVISDIDPRVIVEE